MQLREIVSTDAATQSDRSDAQHANGDSSSIETRQPGANLTDKSESQSLKHPPEIAAISDEIVSSVSCPKYRARLNPSIPFKKSPQTLKKRFSASTITLPIPELANVEPVISRTPAGTKTDRSDMQCANT
jgi:hypothetical protein